MRRRLLVGVAALAVSVLVVAGLAFRFPDVASRLGGSPLPGKGAAPGILIPDQPEPTDGTSPSGPPPTAGASQSPGQGPPPTGEASPEPQPPSFTPIQIEAEDARNSVTGAAQRASYGTASGGILVRDIGSPPGGSMGSLIVPVTVPDSGQYNVLVSIAVPEGPATLTLVVAASGSIPVAVSVTGRSLCCSNGSVAVTLQAGTNWITFGNPTDRGPAIDVIQITRPPK